MGSPECYIVLFRFINYDKSIYDRKKIFDETVLSLEKITDAFEMFGEKFTTLKCHWLSKTKILTAEKYFSLFAADKDTLDNFRSEKFSVRLNVYYQLALQLTAFQAKGVFLNHVDLKDIAFEGKNFESAFFTNFSNISNNLKNIIYGDEHFLASIIARMELKYSIIKEIAEKENNNYFDISGRKAII